MTATVIRVTHRFARRYGHAHPGPLIRIDKKKPGRIPDGGGSRAHAPSERARGRGIDYNSVRTVIHDHSRLAYADNQEDEKGVTAGGVLERAIAF